MNDVRIIFAIQAVRAFVYGFASILIGAGLARSGRSEAEVGLIFGVMLLGMAVATLAVGRWGERYSRRATYAGLLLLMGLAGATFAISDWLPLLLLAALTGTLSTDPNESGPITSLEQAMLAGTPPGARARTFGRYNAVAYVAGALGALAAGGPDALRGLLPALPADLRWLLVLPIGAVVSVALVRRLSPAVEVEGSSARAGLDRSRRSVRQLAGLFALDAFAGGFIVQTFLVFWFGRQFGAGSDLMGLAFFGAGLLAAASSVVAGWLGGRIGLLNTMVFTHLPSNVLLALVPLAPTLPMALGLLLARSALSQMDVPARQAYLAALVDPAERTAAAAYTNAARHLGRPLAPLVGGALMQGVWPGLPFVLAGGLKAVYDTLLFLRFRRVRLAGEAPARVATPSP
jgi:MFS family permease